MKPLTALVLTMLVIAAVGGFTLQAVLENRSTGTVTVVHWTTGHLLRDGSDLRLLRQMASDFNKADHKTASGKNVKIEVFYLGGADQAPELISRVTKGRPLDSKLPDPTLVTPSASHWLVNVNYAAGRDVIDLKDTLSRSLARSYVGIVTYKEMAECLGWPNRDIGYADIIALRNDPRGWGSYSCARAEWGAKPLMAFTDPSASDTGRAVLLTLYALAAGKSPEALTAADLENPDVIAYVKQFQRLVDHYMISTIPLNTKVHQGPRYGHFFIMPEDNLVHLIDGTEIGVDDSGREVTAPPLERDMVMIYPKEGSLLRENCACAVQADWVSDEQREGSEAWFRYLREDRQQSDFMKAGFRPGTNLPVSDPISPAFGLSPSVPATVLNAERVLPAIANRIDASWEEVKRPGIVTLVMDTSGSMEGNKLKQAKDGMILALDNMAHNNNVAFLSFSDKVNRNVPMAPLQTNRFAISTLVESLTASGGTALYDAIRAAIEVSDSADGPTDSIRAVVVLTDGKATAGLTILSDLVTLSSRSEIAVPICRGFDSGPACVDSNGAQVSLKDVIGNGLNIPTRNPVQIFFVGIGDADINVGRILALATGAEFQGATEKDLAEVLEAFSKYF